ncbi:hypothetical protein ACEWY4_016583 [Coilia grayii]|uniref:BSD domain-containing protein n=1 Tax=Coilia grayii TaxID=363190 RepID=A0ABD1JKT2_9TELE
MLKVLDTLLGFNTPDGNELENKVDQKLDSGGETGQNELNTADISSQEGSIQQQAGLSGFLHSFAKRLSATTETIKGNIDGIIDKTIIGDFHKEQTRFLEEKHGKTQEAAVPWLGYSEQETIQQQILALSVDRKNFICDPPGEVQFHFEYEEMYPVAMVMLEEDELLSQMRFALVPKHVTEDRFWRNYFYRLSLITQSAQLSSLATTPAPLNMISPDDVHLEERKLPTPPIIVTAQETNFVEDVRSTSPGMFEFVSDAFDACSIDPDDLRKEMRLTLANTDKAEDDSSDLLKDSKKLLPADS